MKLEPVALDERIEAIDLMRGFSLLGIFIINMLSFHTPLSYIDPYSFFQSPDDKTAFEFIDIFVQASFYPLFALLFGYGLGLQHLRAGIRGRPFIPLAVRRLLVLLLFGIVHAFLIWYGDILITYAVTGFLLIGMLRLPASVLASLGAALYIIPHALLMTITFIAVSANANFYVGIQEVTRSLEAYANGSFSAIFDQRLADWLYANNPANYLFLIITILPFLMIGAAAAKWRLIEQASEYRKLWIGLAVIGLAAGLLLKSTPYTLESHYGFVYVQDLFGGPLVAVGYASVIVLLSQASIIRKLLRPLAKVGRMSLTTYLTQSIVATTIFYSYGFGLYGQIDLVTGTWLALGIFALQLIFAELWLSKFRQGPLELVWRKVTYGLNFEKSNNSAE